MSQLIAKTKPPCFLEFRRYSVFGKRLPYVLIFIVGGGGLEGRVVGTVLERYLKLNGSTIVSELQFCASDKFRDLPRKGSVLVGFW